MSIRRRFAGLGLGLLLVLATIDAAHAARTEWLKIETPRFTVLSQWDENATLALARDYARFVDAAAPLLGTQLDRLPPLTVMLFARDEDFLAYAPEREEGRGDGLVNAFHARRESWAVAGLSVQNRDAATIRRLLFHEGTHWLASANHPQRLPPWLDEGLAQLLETATFDGDRAVWGEPDARLLAFLRGTKPMPLERVLAASRSDPLFADYRQTNAFYAKSWALVHYLLLGRGEGVGEAPGAALVDARDVDPTRLLRRELGATIEETDSRLRSYVRQAALPTAMREARSSTSASLQSVVAPVAEVETGRGRLALTGNHRRLALEHARRAVALADDSPEGHELLALSAGGDDRSREAAATHARRAVQRGSTDVEMRLILGDALGDQPDAANGAVARVRADQYLRAVQSKPRLEAAYERLAWTLADADEITVADVAAMERGRIEFPDDAAPLLGLAVLAHRRGDPDGEQLWLARLSRAPEALDDPSRLKLRALQAQWRYEAAERRVAVLVAADDYRSAIETVERLASELTDATLRAEAANWRDGLLIQERLRAADSALRIGRRAEAREIYETLGERADLSGDLRQWLVLAIERAN